MFSQICFGLQDFIKIVRLLLAAVSNNGLNVCDVNTVQEGEKKIKINK